MKTSPTQSAAAVLLLTATIACRICTGIAGNHIPWMQNFAPVAAIALCGAIYLPRKLALALPLAALLVSDVVLNIVHYHVPFVALEMGSRYVALAATVALGWSLRGHVRFATLIPASLAGSLLFYILTNTASWIDQPGYAKTSAGWLQALTTGLPGYMPTWMFFRSTLASDLLFTVLFVACMSVTRKEGTALPEKQAAATA